MYNRSVYVLLFPALFHEHLPDAVLAVQLRHQNNAEGNGHGSLQRDETALQGLSYMVGNDVVGGPEDASTRHQRENAADEIDRDGTFAGDGQRQSREGDQRRSEKDHHRG